MSPVPRPDRLRSSREYVLWWLVLSGGYFLLIASPTGPEIPIGLAIGVVSAWVAVVARRAFRPPTEVPSFVRGALLLPLDIARDAVEMTWLLSTGRARLRDCGTFDDVVLPSDRATRAWATLLTSAAPGSLAADAEERDGRLVLRRHLLTRHRVTTAGLEER